MSSLFLFGKVMEGVFVYATLKAFILLFRQPHCFAGSRRVQFLKYGQAENLFLLTYNAELASFHQFFFKRQEPGQVPFSPLLFSEFSHLKTFFSHCLLLTSLDICTS
jgi:hypothetical protein